MLDVNFDEVRLSFWTMLLIFFGGAAVVELLLRGVA